MCTGIFVSMGELSLYFYVSEKKISLTEEIVPVKQHFLIDIDLHGNLFYSWEFSK